MATDTQKTSKDSVLEYMKVSIDVLKEQPSLRTEFVLYKCKTHIANFTTPNRTFKDPLIFSTDQPKHLRTLTGSCFKIRYEADIKYKTECVNDVQQNIRSYVRRSNA
jgi:3-methyladenine DNA glycosylase AlkC